MRPVTLALTGTIGAGKSTALAHFKRLGAEVVDCDDIVHVLLKGKDKTLIAKLVHAFGAGMTDAAGIDRKALGERVFKDLAARRKLEALLHPPVIAALLHKARHARCRVFVAEVPLLFEAGLEKYFDATVVIYAPMSIIKERIAGRGYTSQDLKRRIAAQIPWSIKKSKADFAINNSSNNRSYLKNHITKIYEACVAITKGGR